MNHYHLILTPESNVAGDTLKDAAQTWGLYLYPERDANGNHQLIPVTLIHDPTRKPFFVYVHDLDVATHLVWRRPPHQEANYDETYDRDQACWCRVLARHMNWTTIRPAETVPFQVLTPPHCLDPELIPAAVQHRDQARPKPKRHYSPAEKMREALSLVLFFHSGVKWDSEAVAKWEGGLERVFGPVPVTSATHEATTRVLCNAVRAAADAFDNSLGQIRLDVATKNLADFEAVLPPNWESLEGKLGFATDLQIKSWRKHRDELREAVAKAMFTEPGRPITPNVY